MKWYLWWWRRRWCLW